MTYQELITLLASAETPDAEVPETITYEEEDGTTVEVKIKTIKY